MAPEPADDAGPEPIPSQTHNPRLILSPIQTQNLTATLS
jgi:hypothetical protein